MHDGHPEHEREGRKYECMSGMRDSLLSTKIVVAPKYSIVVPFRIEAENVTILYARLIQVMEQTGDIFEIVLVEDGSRDCAYRRLEEIAA